MNTQEILETLNKDGVGQGITLFEGPKDPALVIPADRLVGVCEHLKSAPSLQFDQCILVTGTHMTEIRDKKTKEVTRAEGIEVIYHVRSLRHRALVALKVHLSLEDPRVSSVASIWPAADWHERETYDMVGVVFEGHPNLKRILLPQDWEGFPLRKDYEFPKEYRGISLEVDPPWPQQ